MLGYISIFLEISQKYTKKVDEVRLYKNFCYHWSRLAAWSVYIASWLLTIPPGRVIIGRWVGHFHLISHFTLSSPICEDSSFGIRFYLVQPFELWSTPKFTEWHVTRPFIAPYNLVSPTILLNFFIFKMLSRCFIERNTDSS